MELPKLGLPEKLGENDNVQAYGEELRQLAQLSITKSGDPVEMDRIKQRIAAIKATLPQKEHGRIDDIYSGYVSSGVAAVGDVKGEDGKQILKDIATTNLALGALETGVGIVQALKGHAEKNKLEPPKFPTDLAKNPTLQNRINDVTILATEGDKKLRSFFEDKLAEIDTVSAARAKNTGGAGQFAANIQANRLTSDKALRDFAAEESTRKTQASRDLSSLIYQDTNEDFRLKNLEMDKFDAQNKAYTNSLTGAQNQINSGLTNTFTGLKNIGGALPYYKNTTNGGINNATNPVTAPIGSLPSSPSTLSAQVPAVDYASQPTVGELLALGNTAQRTPDQVMKFQKFAAENLNLSGFEEGIFDQPTQKAFNDFYYIR